MQSKSPKIELCHGNNLVVLRNLITQRRQPDLVYYDPPYQKGHNFADTRLGTSRHNGYDDNHRPEDYENYIRLLIQATHVILPKHGNLVIQCDDSAQLLIQTLLAKTFKEVRMITWQRSVNNTAYRGAPQRCAAQVDYLLVASKTGQGTFHPQTTSTTTSPEENKSYQLDEHGEYFRWDPATVRNPSGATTSANTKTQDRYESLWGYNPVTQEGRKWRRPHYELKRLAAAGHLTFSCQPKNFRIPANWKYNGRGKPQMRTYWAKKRPSYVGNLWTDIPNRQNVDDPFVWPTQKPPALLQRIFQMFSNPGSLVVDGFTGGGNSLVAAYQTGRSCVGMDTNPKAIQIARQRCEFYGIPLKTS